VDGLRWFRLVGPVRESLRDNQIQPLPDWGVKWCELPDVQPCILHVDRDHQVAESAVGESTPTPLSAS
jgi:hypothetical protein